MKAIKKSLIFFVLPVFLPVFFATPLHGEESRVVFIVTNPGVTPYKEIIEGIRNKLKVPSLMIDISHDGGDKPFLTSSHFGVIAIGEKGWVEAKRMFPDSPKVAVFLDNEGICLKKLNIKCQVISLFPDPGRAFSVFKSLFPNKKRIGVLFDKSTEKSYRKLVEAKGLSLGLSIITREAEDETEVVKAITALAQESEAFFYLPQSIFTFTTQKFLFETFLIKKKAVFSTSYRAAHQGALFSTIITNKRLGEKVAESIEKFMKNENHNSQGLVYLSPEKIVCNKNIAKNLEIPLSKIDKIVGDCQ